MIVAAALLALLMLGAAGVQHVGMNMHGDGQMVPCPFMGEGAICDMNPLEHIAAWQSAFAASFQKDSGGALALILFAALLVLAWWRRLFTGGDPPLLRRWHSAIREGVRKPDPLQEAFSNGVLHPKEF